MVSQLILGRIVQSNLRIPSDSVWRKIHKTARVRRCSLKPCVLVCNRIQMKNRGRSRVILKNPQNYLRKNRYVLVPAEKADIDRVRGYYSHHPVPGMDIVKIEVIYNQGMHDKFAIRLGELQQRHGNEVFKPKWDREDPTGHRKVVSEACRNLSAPHRDNQYPNVNLMPVWHGTKKLVLSSIFSAAYAT